MLKKAGYGGERIVLMHPTDQIILRRHHAASSLSSLRQVGLNLDEQTLDWGTVVQRRTNKEPLDKGGWSIFPYGAPAAEYRDPIFATNSARQRQGCLVRLARRREDGGDAQRPGWTATTKLRTSGSTRKSRHAPSRLCPFIPLGQYLPPSAWRSNLQGLLKGAVPVFWNVTKA